MKMSPNWYLRKVGKPSQRYSEALSKIGHPTTLEYDLGPSVPLPGVRKEMTQTNSGVQRVLWSCRSDAAPDIKMCDGQTQFPS